MARRRKHGSGGLTQRPNGSWTAQVTIATKGGRVRRTYTRKSKEDVEFWLREASRAARRGDEPTETRRTLGDHLDDWLAEVSHAVKPVTLYGYTIQCGWIRELLGDVPLVDLAPEHVKRLRDHIARKGKSPRWIQSVMTTLRMALRQAVRDGLVPRNVADGVRPPRQVRKRVTATSPVEAKAILAAFRGHHLEQLVTVAIGTGLRLGELLGLRWADVAGGTVRVGGSVRRAPTVAGGRHTLQWTAETKTHRSHRTVTAGDLVTGALDAQRRAQLADGLASPYVFVTRGRRDHDGEAMLMDPKNVTRSFQSQLKTAGLPRMRFHDLRHAYATLMLGQGVPLRVIQEALGHTSVVTTAAVYAHVLPELQRDAAERLDHALMEAE